MWLYNRCIHLSLPREKNKESVCRIWQSNYLSRILTLTVLQSSSVTDSYVWAITNIIHNATVFRDTCFFHLIFQTHKLEQAMQYSVYDTSWLFWWRRAIFSPLSPSIKSAKDGRVNTLNLESYTEGSWVLARKFGMQEKVQDLQSFEYLTW